MQRAANAAMESGLRKLDKRQGWRGRIDRVPTGTDPAKWASASWRDGVTEGAIVDGVVVSAGRGRVRVKAGALEGALDPESIAWTGKADPGALVKQGDVVRVRVLSAKIESQAVFGLEQEPAVEGALVAIDPATGEVRALVGGFDFRRSEFDRSVQARRQAGSAFKPIVYTAALMRGLTLGDRVLDAPTVFVEPGTLTPYQPENYGLKYYGLLTLREALEKSANVATVRVLDQTGYAPVIDLARKLGLTTALRPYPSMALGAFEVSLLELTSAYGAFAHEGVRVEPHLVLEVRDRDGTALETARPAATEALSPEVAAVVNALLAGVITDGTGAAAAQLGRPLAGKTGTTDESTDAWFIGYTPDLVVGVWVGFDQKKSLGSRETGAVAALPIWQTFMERVLANVPPREFSEPQGIARVSIDRATGLRADVAAGCTEIVTESFLAGTEPTATCTAAEHIRLALPWTLQRYPLDADGALVVPDEDLGELIAADPSIRVDGATIGTDAARLPIHVVAGKTPRVPASIDGQVDPTAWVGKDGRPAEVVLLGEATRQ
jgi:penicillin-binding protein 1A